MNLALLAFGGGSVTCTGGHPHLLRSSLFCSPSADKIRASARRV
jgi:hypothetical protein